MEHENEEYITSSLANANQADIASAFETRQPPPMQFKFNSEPDQEDQESEENTGLSYDADLPPDDEVLPDMEMAFGQSFSDVNFIKNSSQASGMGARAFAQGTDVHFAPGEYNPSTENGRALIGHELTHVVQQKQGRVTESTQLKGFKVNNDSSLEKEADLAGLQAARGNRVNLPPFSLSGGGTNVIQGNDGLLALFGLETGREFNERRQRERPAEQADQAEALEERRRHPEQWNVAFDIADGTQVIREYDSSHERRSSTTYVDSRDYYRVGDIILTSELQESVLRDIFPGLSELLGEEQQTSIIDVLNSYMDSSSGERKIGWKITSIENAEPDTGAGNVSLRAVMFISGTEAVEIEGHNSTRSYGRDMLSTKFSELRAFASLTTLIQVIATATEFSMSLLNGSAGMRAVGRTLGAAGLRMLPGVLRGPALRIVRFIGGALVTSCFRIARTVISDIQEQEGNNQIRERAGREQHEMHYEDIITEAIVSELTSVITNRFSEFLNERISRGLAEHLPSFLQQSLGARFRVFIAQQIAGGLGRGLHLGAALAAARRRANRGEDFGQALGTELRNRLAPVVSDPGSAAQSILGSFVSSFSSTE